MGCFISYWKPQKKSETQNCGVEKEVGNARLIFLYLTFLNGLFNIGDP